MRAKEIGFWGLGSGLGFENWKLGFEELGFCVRDTSDLTTTKLQERSSAWLAKQTLAYQYLGYQGVESLQIISEHYRLSTRALLPLVFSTKRVWITSGLWLGSSGGGDRWGLSQEPASSGSSSVCERHRLHHCFHMDLSRYRSPLCSLFSWEQTINEIMSRMWLSLCVSVAAEVELGLNLTIALQWISQYTVPWVPVSNDEDCPFYQHPRFSADGTWEDSNCCSCYVQLLSMVSNWYFFSLPWILPSMLGVNQFLLLKSELESLILRL